jgi:type VI secretion system VasD/TssJ family lipoprotein
MTVDCGNEHPVHHLRGWPRPATALLVAALLIGATGCGWIFNKQHKPLKITVTFAADSLLNFDGTRYQSVQVKAYILKRCERFFAADPQAFFDPDYAPTFMSDFGQDTLGSVTIIIAPGEQPRPLTIEIPFIRVREEDPKFAVIANFARPPLEGNGERMCFDIKKKKQTIKVELGSDWVKVKGKKSK